MYCYENLTRPIYNLKASTLMAFDADKVFVRIFPVAKSPPGELIKRITTFFEREMSVDNDVLDALAGIFAEFRNRPRVSDEMVSRGSIITAHCDTPEVSLDRVDTLYGLPLYPKHAFQWQYNLCPTAIVALALCWDIYGPVLRRKDFPSWSWAGWKVDRTPERTQPYKYRHSLSFGPLDILINRQGWMSDHPPPVAFPIRIEVSTMDGSWASWEDNWQGVVAEPDMSEKAKSLKIRGWTCPLRLERIESKWKICYPEKLLESSIYALTSVDEMDLGLPGQDGCTLSLKALVIYINPPHKLSDLSSKTIQWVQMLILREVQTVLSSGSNR